MASKDEKIQKALGSLWTYEVTAYRNRREIDRIHIDAKNEDRAIVKLKLQLLAQNKSIDGLTYEARRI